MNGTKVVDQILVLLTYLQQPVFCKERLASKKLRAHTLFKHWKTSINLKKSIYFDLLNGKQRGGSKPLLHQTL